MINITHVYAEVLAWFNVKNGSWGGPASLVLLTNVATITTINYTKIFYLMF